MKQTIIFNTLDSIKKVEGGHEVTGEVTEPKQVELIKGNWYYAYTNEDSCVFRCKNELEAFSHINLLTGEIKRNVTISMECTICLSETLQIKKGTATEESNGLYWDDKKKDFLKLEDVYCDNLNIKEKLDIYSVNRDYIADTCTFSHSCKMVYFDAERNQLCDCINNSRKDELKQVTKDVFIDLLKHRKEE